MELTYPVIGHRGASAYAPENTLAAFAKARFLGCSCLEFDVTLSADGEPFVFHDNHLKRTSNGKGEIGLVQADYLRSLDAGSWFGERFRGEKIPHLSSVLRWLWEHHMQANLEIKPHSGTAEAIAVAVLSTIHSLGAKAKLPLLISSFNEDILHLCRSLSPELPLGWLLHHYEDNAIKKALQLQCYSIHCNAAILNAERIRAIKKEGLVLYAYTVNSKRRAQKLLKAGVDAVFSDYPDLLL